MKRDKRRTFAATTVLIAPFVILLAALAAAGPSLREWGQKRQHGGEPQSIDINLYTFWTDRDLGDCAIFGFKLDRFERELVTRTKDLFGLSVRSVPIRIHLYHNHDELERFLKRTTSWKGDFTHNGGYYNPAGSEIAIEMTGDEREDISGLFHEVTHALFNLSAERARWSPWVAEGVATWLARSEIGPEGAVRLGGIDHRFLAINREGPLPLREFLEADHSQFTTAQNRYYYAQAHLLFAFLVERHRDRLAAYLKSEMSGVKVGPATFESTFGPIPDIEKEFADFVKSLN
ncbi:MAG: hypothetical protein A2Z34_08880 [Planctomycetes bacterium RBG_16_59_8]|nr:MAG: hypothetical protein A2Z34_08880 [Planctomycetes bacterium RBG_16_59_8]